MSKDNRTYAGTVVSGIIRKMLRVDLIFFLLILLGAPANAQSCPDIELRCPTGEEFTIGSCLRNGQCQTCNSIHREIENKCPTPYPNNTQRWLDWDDGCSVPGIKSPSTQVFRAPCAIHDLCYAGPQGKNMCDEQIETNMKAICSLPGVANVGSSILSAIAPVPNCETIAGSFHLALSTASDARASYDGGQAFRRDNDSQAVTRSRTAERYLIRQSSTGRFLDAYQSQGRDYAVTTRPIQPNQTQIWVLTEVDPSKRHYRIQQYVNGRYLDAYRTEGRDFGVTTRPYQTNDTQVWELSERPGSESTVTIRQVGARNRAGYLDAYGSSGRDFRTVTRPEQRDATQQWTLTRIR